MYPIDIMDNSFRLTLAYVRLTNLKGFSAQKMHAILIMLSHLHYKPVVLTKQTVNFNTYITQHAIVGYFPFTLLKEPSSR